MGYNYGFEYAFPDAVEGAAEGLFVGTMGIATGFLLIFWLLLMGVSVVSYVLHAAGMYRIAKRRGIHHAWLAWIPVGNAWLLGSISDHYQYVVKQKTTKRRRSLLILEVIMYALIFLVLGLTIAMILSLEADAMTSGIGAAAGVMIFGLALEGVSIAALVFCYIAYYDLFRSCRPEYDVLFLVLGIFFPVTLPFFVFGCSSSDKGMPARRPPQRPPVQIPYEPVEPAAPAEEPEIPAEPAEEEIPVVETEIVEDPE